MFINIYYDCSFLFLFLESFIFPHFYSRQVAFDKIGSMTENLITKQRKKQEPAVLAELDQRFKRLNPLKTDDDEKGK